MEKCQRCEKNEISLQCLHCPTINKICSLCDRKIHNSTSKINHCRIPIENMTISIKDNLSFENRKEPNENLISYNNKDMIIIENDNEANELQQEDDKLNAINYNNIKNISAIMKNNNSSVIIDNENLNNNNNFTYDISTMNQSANNYNNNLIRDDPIKYSKTKYYLSDNKNIPLNDPQHISFSQENNINKNNISLAKESNSVFNKN